LWRGTGSAGDQEKRGREVGLSRWGENGRKKEEICNIVQYFAIKKNAKRREPTNTGREPGFKGTGSGRFSPPCPLPPPSFCSIHETTKRISSPHGWDAGPS